MTGYDSWPQFRFLTQEVLDALNRRRGERWEVATWHEDHAHPAVTLAPAAGTGPEHARIWMQHGFDAAGKVTVKGIWPDGSTYKAPARNVDPGRGAKAIAQAIHTYILSDPYAYLGDLTRRAENKQREEERVARRAAIMARFAGLFQLDPPGDEDLSLSRLLPMRGEVSLDHNTTDDGQDAPRVSLELHGLDVATAEAMLTAMAASPAIQARCCEVFGPGHDPRLARLGCRRATGRQDKPTWDEGSALFDLYRRSGTAQSWEQWLGPDAADIHGAWR